LSETSERTTNVIWTEATYTIEYDYINIHILYIYMNKQMNND